MRPRGLTLLIASALCAGLLIVAFISARSKTELSTQLANAAARQAEIRDALRAITEHRPVKTESLTTPATLTPESKSEAPSSAPRKALGLMDVGVNQPQLLNYFILSKKSEIAQRYGPFFQNLNLPPEQREKFKEIMAAATARSVDIGTAAHALGLPRTDATVLISNKESEAQRQAELEALLGGAGCRELKEYERTINVRGFVDGLAAQVAPSAPLNAQQAEQLTRVLAMASPTYREGKFADPTDLDWTMVDQQAQGVLTPAQFSLWKLGIAHNPDGGSRQVLELKKIYEQAVKNASEATDREE